MSDRTVNLLICLTPIALMAVLAVVLWYRTPPMRFTHVGRVDQPYHGGAPYGTLLYPVDMPRGR